MMASALALPMPSKVSSSSVLAEFISTLRAMPSFSNATDASTYHKHRCSSIPMKERGKKGNHGGFVLSLTFYTLVMLTSS